jgi:hypothetical protein
LRGAEIEVLTDRISLRSAFLLSKGTSKKDKEDKERSRRGKTAGPDPEVDKNCTGRVSAGSMSIGPICILHDEDV